LVSGKAVNFKLNQSAQLITPNQRLAKYLLTQHKKTTLTFSGSSVKTFYQPKICSFDNWLHMQFEYLQEHLPFEYGKLQLLTTQQEKFLWQEIINNDSLCNNLLLKQSIVTEVMKAHSLTYDWNINKKTIVATHYFISLDQKSFFSWQEIFEKKCSQKNHISQSQLLPLIHNALEKNILPLEDQYIFFGFDELSPSKVLLQQQLKALNKTVKNDEDAKRAATYQKTLKCRDFEEEIFLASEWANSIRGNNKDAQIAIVIPSLAQNRQLILNTFIQTLNTSSYCPGNSIYPLNFNISSGVSLSSIPIIKTAMMCIHMQMLNIQGEKIASETLSEFIRNPFLFNLILSKSDKLKIDQVLKSAGKSEFNIQEIINIFKNSHFEITKLMSKIFSDKRLVKQLKTHLEWREHFLQVLECFQWLKEKQLDSESFQAVKKFMDLLNEFSKLDDYFGKCDLPQAIIRIEDFIKGELFQAESINESEKNIHVLGTLEAAGQSFSHLWVCEVNDKTWPSKPHPNAFLPIGLQKELHMPHSSAQRELDFSKKIIHRFQQECNNIIYSFSENEKDEGLSLSPLISEIEITSKEQLIEYFQLKIPDSLDTQIFKTKETEYFNDQTLIPITKNETLIGGQGIIKSQGLCPFNAFSSYRLTIKAFEEEKDSLSAIDRGNILHKLMELFWKEVKNHAQLIELSDEQIANLLNKHCEIIRNQNIHNVMDKEIAFSLELNRAQEVALLFLNAEKQREPFEVIGFEVKQEQTIQDLHLSLRVDRIDRLEDGSEIIIDYKTNNTQSNSWIPPRIDEPQLPIYLMNNPKAEAIAYGVLNKNEQEFGLKGIASRLHPNTKIFNCTDERKNKKLPSQWNDILQIWKLDIENQASNFIQGVNFVDPKNKNISCTYCDFLTICRVNEIIDTDYDADEAEDFIA